MRLSCGRFCISHVFSYDRDVLIYLYAATSGRSSSSYSLPWARIFRHFLMSKIPYSGWKKSYTTLDGWNPINNIIMGKNQWPLIICCRISSICKALIWPFPKAGPRTTKDDPFLAARCSKCSYPRRRTATDCGWSRGGSHSGAWDFSDPCSSLWLKHVKTKWPRTLHHRSDSPQWFLHSCKVTSDIAVVHKGES